VRFVVVAQMVRMLAAGATGHVPQVLQVAMAQDVQATEAALMAG
jgi:hypothetical protein